MRIDELIEGLRDDLEWARANEWETPIMLGDHISEAIDILTKIKQRQTKYNEIVRLHEMLTGANIPHKFAHYSDGYRITYKMDKNSVAVIFEHGTSYGHECDLLELSVNGGSGGGAAYRNHFKGGNGGSGGCATRYYLSDNLGYQVGGGGGSDSLSVRLLTENEMTHAGLVKSVGWLTANNVFQRILKHWEGMLDGSECEIRCRENQADVGADGDH